MVRIMNNAGLNSKNIVRNVSNFNDSVFINNILGMHVQGNDFLENILGMNCNSCA